MTPHNRLRDLFQPSAGPRSSPLVQAADPRNVSAPTASEVQVELGTDWPTMLADLRRVGPVLSVTRNAHAVVGREGALPELTLRNHFGQSGEMEFDFRQWRSARAIHSRRENRNVYSIEWLDAHEDVHHKTCLTGQANLAEFLAWIERHQKSEFDLDQTGPSFYSLPLLPLPESGPLAHRGCVEYLLREAISFAQAIRISVGNAASRQTASFIPTSLSLSDQWCFVSGEHTGVHLRTRNLAEVLIHKTADTTGGFLTLKLHDPEARLIAEIAPPTDAKPAQWNDFLRSRLVPMPPLPSA